jgi:hypothetical protein
MLSIFNPVRSVQGLAGKAESCAFGHRAIRAAATLGLSLLFAVGPTPWTASALAIGIDTSHALYDCADTNVSVSGTISAQARPASHIIDFSNAPAGTPIHITFRSDADGETVLSTGLVGPAPGSAAGGGQHIFTEALAQDSEDWRVTGSDNAAAIALTLMPPAAEGERAAVSYWVSCHAPRHFSVTADGNGAEPSDAGHFTVHVNLPASHDMTLGYALGGTAEAGADFETPAGQVSIPAGAIAADIPLAVLDDALQEGTENVTLTLLPNDEGMLEDGAANATIEIADDEKLAIETGPGPFVVTEPDGPSSTEIPVHLSDAPQEDVTLAVAVDDDSEIEVKQAVLTFTPENWQEPQLLRVDARPDGIADGDQTADVVISDKGANVAVKIAVVVRDANGKFGAFGSNGEAEAFEGASRTFLRQRLRLLAENVAHLPDSGTAAAPIALHGSDGTVSADLKLSSNATARADRKPGSTRLWSDATASFFTGTGDASKGGFLNARLGTDVAISDGALLGLVVSLDAIDLKDAAGDAHTKGTGWLAGAYLDATVAGDMSLNVMALAGTSSNDMTLSGFSAPITARFGTERALLSAELTGRYDMSGFTVKPNLRASYGAEFGSDSTLSDGLGGSLDVPGVNMEFASLSAGADVNWLKDLGDVSVEPFVGGDVGWEWASGNTSAPVLGLRGGVTAHTAAMDVSARAQWHGHLQDHQQDFAATLSASVRF